MDYLLNLLKRAEIDSHKAHDSINQKRKYSGEPYWVHTDEVSRIVEGVGGTIPMIIAAKFHDLLEDVFPINPFYSYEWINNEYGQEIAGYVFDLTDQYSKENYPHWNREIRKKKEAERLGAIHVNSKTIKLADILSNSRDIIKQDQKFAKTYLKEKLYILSYLKEGNQELWFEAMKIVDENRHLILD